MILVICALDQSQINNFYCSQNNDEQSIWSCRLQCGTPDEHCILNIQHSLPLFVFCAMEGQPKDQRRVRQIQSIGYSNLIQLELNHQDYRSLQQVEKNVPQKIIAGAVEPTFEKPSEWAKARGKGNDWPVNYSELRHLQHYDLISIAILLSKCHTHNVLSSDLKIINWSIPKWDLKILRRCYVV